MMPPGTAIPEARALMKAELGNFVPSYQKLLPPGYAPERLITGALVAAAKNPDLFKCTPLSVALSLAQIAQWGLEIGYTAYIIPYGNVCTPIADYKGLIELMLDAGAKKVESREVRAGDRFSYGYGLTPFLEHTPVPGSTADITGAYAIIWLPGGVQQFEYMAAAEIDKIRQEKSKQWKEGKLTKWYARKTVLRQLAKYVPKHSSRLAALMKRDDIDPDQFVAEASDLLLPPGPAPSQEDLAAQAREQRAAVKRERQQQSNANQAEAMKPAQPPPPEPPADAATAVEVGVAEPSPFPAPAPATPVYIDGAKRNVLHLRAQERDLQGDAQVEFRKIVAYVQDVPLGQEDDTKITEAHFTRISEELAAYPFKKPK